MKRTLPLLLAFWAISAIAHAQASISEAAQQIAASLREIGDEKTTISQSLEADKAKPYRFAYSRRTTDSKGKANEEKWEFNLADIDANTVRWEDKGKSLPVAMRTLREQRFIRYSRNGEPQGYTDHVEFLGKGIDNARDLERLAEAAIPLAREAWEKEASIQDKAPADLLDMLFRLVGEAPSGAQTLRQKLSPNGDFPDRLRLTVEVFSDKGLLKKEAFVWSLGDLTEQTVRLSMQGSRATVEAKTRRNLRWVTVEKDGSAQGFDNEIQIAVADPDQGKMVQALLQKLIPYGEEQIRARLPQTTTAAETLRRLAATQQKFSREKTDFEQTLRPECLSMLTQRKSGEKKTDVSEYTFHFGDLNDKSISLEIGSKSIEVEIATAEREKFVAVAENGEAKNFEAKIAFRFPDLEQARLFEHLLPVAVGQCQQKPAPKDFGWLKKCAADAEKANPSFSQKLEVQSLGATCKWRFTSVEAREKKSRELVFELNLYDLDPKQVNISVNGRAISLDLQTKYRQKIITRYEDGKPDYGAEFSILMPDLESAKTARETVIALIGGCKQ